MERGQHAERNADDAGQGKRGQAQHRRVLKTRQYERSHLLALADRAAKVALDRMSDPGHVLPDEGLIEAEIPAHLGQDLRRGAWPRHDDGGVTRGQVHHREND